MSKPIGRHQDGTNCWTKNCTHRNVAADFQKRLSYNDKKEILEYNNVFRICIKCNNSLPLIEFSRVKKNKSGFSGTCRSCAREVREAYYRNNKIELDKKAALRKIVREAENKAFIKNYKLSHPCIDCGENNLSVLDFDHRSGSNKKGNIGDILYTFTLARLKEEIKKCEIRCANCHRIKTYQNDTWRTGKVKATEHLPRISKNNALNQRKLQEELLSWMANGCVDCKTKDIRILEFDHVRGEKLNEISNLVRRSVSINKLRVELAKCEVRCANCHRIVTRARETQIRKILLPRLDSDQ